MGDLEVFRCVLKYEMILHKLKMKYDKPNEVDLEYTENDMLKTSYNIMIFHRGMLNKDNTLKKDFLKMIRNLTKVKIRAIKKANSNA